MSKDSWIIEKEEIEMHYLDGTNDRDFTMIELDRLGMTPADKLELMNKLDDEKRQADAVVTSLPNAGAVDLKIKDLVGRKFGEITALMPTTHRLNGKVIWACRCDCGAGHLLSSSELLFGKVHSCATVTHIHHGEWTETIDAPLTCLSRVNSHDALVEENKMLREALTNIIDLPFKTIEPNGADIPMDMEAYIRELQDNSIAAESIATEALSKSTGEK